MLDRERSLPTSAFAKNGTNSPKGDSLDMDMDLDLERDLERRLNSENGSIDELLEGRVHRTTIVPKPIGSSGLVADDQEEPTRSKLPPQEVDISRFKRDEPTLGGSDLDDPGFDELEQDEPTRVGRTAMASAVRLDSDNANVQLRPNGSLSRVNQQERFSERQSPPVSAPRMPAQPPGANRFGTSTLLAPTSNRLPSPPLPLPSGRTSSTPPPLTTTRISALPPKDVGKPHSAAPPPRTSGASPAADPEHSKSEKWYLRVQLNTDCVADLWVRDLTPHNVLVWSDDMESWVPLLTVRELRDAIRDAHDSKTREQHQQANLVFVNTQTSEANRAGPGTQSRLASPLSAPARAASQWALPKPRTISNVPPPLLTTAVPVVASVQRDGATSQRLTHARSQYERGPSQASVPPYDVSATSSVPPVVTPLELAAARYVDAVSLPDIPKPARLPAVDGALTYEPSIRLSDTQRPPRRFRAPPPSLLKPWQRTVQVTANTVISSIPLVHLERFLWLAAGVAVASAVMLLMRDNDHALVTNIEPARLVPQTREPAPVAKDGEPSTSKTTVPIQRVTSTARSTSDIHRLEDLPVVGAPRESEAVVSIAQLATVPAAPAAPMARATPVPVTPPVAGLPTRSAATPTKGGKAGNERSRVASGTVIPAQITLASTPNSVAATTNTAVTGTANAAPALAANPVPTPSTGSFDIGAARRVLTSSAGRAARCAADGPASGSVLITFAPTGFVQSATMSGLSGNGVNVGCVIRAFQEARVSPFSGPAVTVRKGFQIQ